MSDMSLTIPAVSLASEPPASLLESLASHARAAGACLIWLASDGSVVHYDTQAGPFYDMFAMPGLRCVANDVVGYISTLTPQCGVQTWDIIPGVTVVAAPIAHRRQVRGMLALAAKGEEF